MAGLRRAEDIHYAEVGDEFFVTLERRDVVACINRSAFEVIENLDGSSDPESLAEELAKSRGVDPGEYAEAVRKVCDVALEAGLLERGGAVGDRREPLVDRRPDAGPYDLPRVLNVWTEEDLAGGLFVNSVAGDIHVIVPNVTDGPIRTCPAHTCTIPAGLFTAETIIKTFAGR